MEPTGPDGPIKDTNQENDRKERSRRRAGNSKASDYPEVEPEHAEDDERDYLCEGSNRKCINGLITYAYRPEPYDDPQNRFAKYKPVFCSDCHKGRQLKARWEIEEGNNRRNFLLEQSNLPVNGVFKDLTLESFALTANGATGWFKEVKAWVENWNLDKEKGLVLYGKCGVGKTGLIVAALKELINRHCVRVYYITIGEFIERIGEAWLGRKGDDHLLLRVMSEADILFLDEIGTGHARINEVGDNTPLGNLFKVIDFRHRNGRPIILATNCETPSELMEVLGEKNFNRVYESCKGVPCSGKNLRQQRET